MGETMMQAEGTSHKPSQSSGIVSLTAARERALRIFVEHGPLMAGRFAHYMWPDSPGWKRVINCGYGATQGRGMYMAGGSYIGKLRKLGLVDYVWKPGVYEFRITSKGRELLRAAKDDE